MILDKICYRISGEESSAKANEWFEKLNPANGKLLAHIIRSRADDVSAAIASAKSAFPAWSEIPAVWRGLLLHKIVVEMQNHQDEIARIIAPETGRSYKDALGETEGAIQ